jgi:hypothetical protein
MRRPRSDHPNEADVHGSSSSSRVPRFGNRFSYHRDEAPSRAHAPLRVQPEYYRTVVSKEVFASLDSYLWQLTYRWAVPRHPKKSRHWIVDRYFGRFNTARQDRWVFGDRGQ